MVEGSRCIIVSVKALRSDYCSHPFNTIIIVRASICYMYSYIDKSLIHCMYIIDTAELVPNAKYLLRLVEADLTKPDTWPKVIDRCAYVFHVASPVIFGADEASIIRTAVEGTTNVLQACANTGSIKRVVLTSSCVAVSSEPVGNPGNPPEYVYTEKDWAVESACTAYGKSKLKAEQAAWEFVKKLDESKRFELVVVNPSYVQGPLLSASSGEVLQ